VTLAELRRANVILTLAEYTLWSFTKSRCHFDFVELTADPNMDIVKFTIGCCTFSIIRVVEFKIEESLSNNRKKARNLHR
jgi:hypothetical protein